MGQKQSTFSKFDDLVVDHNDVLARLKQVFGALGSKGSSCTLPLTESFSIPNPKAHPISGCSSCDSISVIVHCDAAIAATQAVKVHTPCSRDDGEHDINTIKAVQCELAAASAEAAAEAAAAVRPVAIAPAAAVATSAADDARQAAAIQPKTVLLRPAVVPPLPDLTKLSISSAAVTARDEVERVFNSVDWEQQHQDQAAALDSLAAAASNSAQLTEQEKAALQEAGRQARLAEAAELGAQVDANDAALKAMSEKDREQWFQEHAKQQQTDAPEMDFEDEWASLPPEVLAMVAEMQSR